MTSRRFLLALPALLGAGSAVRALAGPVDPALDPILRGDLPICRGGLQRIADVPQRDASTPVAREADYLEKLGLLEGHLLVGRRLLEAKQPRLAIPHFGHPIRELYTFLEPRLAAHRAPGFERELEVMEDWAERGNTGTGGAFADAWTALAPKLAAAKASIAPGLRADPRFMLEHVALMAYDVASDYGESIERGRIVNIVEYHDSMGFLLYAQATAAEQRAQGGRAGAEWAEAETVLEELRSKVYPELLPSSRPPASVSSVRGRYDQIRAIAARAQA